MTIPTPHTIIVITPVEATDGYGDTVLDYTNGTRRGVAAYVQPASTSETPTADRDPIVWDLLVFTTDRQVTGRDRVEWRGVTYVCDGRPDGWETPAGFHHVELRLHAAKG